MKYKYCTKEMVDKAVKQGREAVIQCASDKWWFFGTCTEKQFRWYGGHKGLGPNCALCGLFNPTKLNGCKTCPLYSMQGSVCNNEETLYNSLVDSGRLAVSNPTATNFKKFQAKARKLARVIGRLK